MEINIFGDGKYFHVYRQIGDGDTVVVKPTPHLLELLEYLEGIKKDAERFQAYLDSLEEKDGE